MAGNSDLVADKVAALRLAERMGCRGAHQHPDGKWMPCETMEEYEKLKDNRPTSQKTGLDIIEQNRRYRSRKGKKKRGWEPLGERGLTSIDTMSGGGLTGGRSGTIKALWAPTVGDTDVFSNARQARRRARELGCIGISRRRSGSGKTVWTPCSNMTDYQKRTGSTAFGRNWQRQQARRQMQSAVEREVRRQLRRKESLTEMLYAEKALGRKLRSARIATSARFDPNAVDADADAIVQEGTPFERPALPGRRLARRAQRMGRRMQARQTRRRIERDPEYPVDAPMSDSEIDRHYADWLERNPGYIDDATPHVQNMLSSRAHGAAEGLRSRRSPPDGKPSKIERAKKQILDRIKPEHRDKVERKIHWVFGSPGTGKTHLLKSGAVDAPGRDAAVHVNPDDLKPHLPGYDGPNGDSTTHMHSVAEAADLMDSAAEGGMDMVVQGTGKNNPLIARHVQDETGYGDKTVRKRKKGVTSIAHLIYGGSADTTNDRIDRRNADPHSKQRNRPFGSDRELLEERMRLADQIERGWFDEVYIYDNSANTKNPPLVAYRTKDGQFQILDRKKFNDFFGDQRHPLDPHGRTGAQRVEEAWIGQRDGTPLLSGERGRGWRPDQHFDSAIPGDGRTYREILDKLGYEEQTKKRPKPLQGPPTPRGMGYRDPDIGEEEEENLGYFMPDGTWIPTGGSIEEENEAYRRATGMTPKTPENPTQTDIERRRREGAEERRERRGERRGGVRSSRGVDPVEDTYNYGRGLRSVKRRNEESLATLEELGGHYSWAGMAPEEKRAWIAAELEKTGYDTLFVPSSRTGVGHFTDVDGQGLDGKDRIIANLDKRLAHLTTPEMRNVPYGPEQKVHLERLREFVESKTPEELHAAVLKWGRELYDDPDNLVAVMDAASDVEMVLNQLVYRTTHAGGLRPSSDASIRTGLEVLHGYPARTPEGVRPASGFLIPGAMVRRLRERMNKEQTRTSVTDIFSDDRSISMLSQGAAGYGETMMILRPEVKERSRVGAGDMLNDLPSTAPLVGATDDEIVDALVSVNGRAKGGHNVEGDILSVLERVMMGLDGSSLGRASENLFKDEDGLVGSSGNDLIDSHGYHEVLIHGSFTTGDIQTIVERSNDRTRGGPSYEGENSEVVMKEIAAAIDDAKELGLSQEDIDTVEKHLTRTTGQPPRVTGMDISDEIVNANSGQIRLTGSAQSHQSPYSKRGQNRERAERLSYGEDTPMEYRYTSGADWHGIDWENPRSYARHYEEGDTLDDVIRRRRKESFESIAAALREPKGGERREGVRSSRSDRWEEGKPLSELAQELADDDDAEYIAEYEKKYGHPPPNGDGDCYAAASQTAIDIDSEGTVEFGGRTYKPRNIEVVHGTPLGTGGDAEGLWYGHAWVEFDVDMEFPGMDEPVTLRLVRDASNGKNITFPAEAYYNIGSIDPNDAHRYTIPRVHEMQEAHGMDTNWARYERDLRQGLASRRTSATEREATIAMVSESLEMAGMLPLSDKDLKKLKNAESIRIAAHSNAQHTDRIEIYGDFRPPGAGPVLPSHTTTVIGISGELRAAVKLQGIKAIADEITPEEALIITTALPELRSGNVPNGVEVLVDRMHDKWTRVSGGHDAGALLLQLSMARKLGWSDEKIEKEIFHAVPRVEWNEEAQDFIPRDINYADLKKKAAKVVRYISERYEDGRPARQRDRDHLIRQRATGRNEGEHVLVQALALEHYYGEAYQAVLAAEQRASVKRLKARGIEKLTLYRGVIFEGSGSEAEHLDALVDQPPQSLGADRPGSPLTSWSITESTARYFADMHSGANAPELTGYVIKSEVSIDDIVGLSTNGFGCVVEGECIVRHGEQTIQVLERITG